MNLEASQITALRTQLEQLGADYLCTTPLPSASVAVKFLGKFQGQVVVWEMTLGTLAYYRALASENTFTSYAELKPCSFIEVQAGIEGVYPVKVGHDLAVIDAPAIKKTIIMMRNYKRLIIGKIEFTPNT